MTLEGTVVNGVVVFDGAPTLPEGSRVRAKFIDREDETDDTPETYAEHLANLRESIAAVRAGERGVPLREAMARIAADLNLPAVDSE